MDQPMMNGALTDNLTVVPSSSSSSGDERLHRNASIEESPSNDTVLNRLSILSWCSFGSTFDSDDVADDREVFRSERRRSNIIEDTFPFLKRAHPITESRDDDDSMAKSPAKRRRRYSDTFTRHDLEDDERDRLPTTTHATAPTVSSMDPEEEQKKGAESNRRASTLFQWIDRMRRGSNFISTGEF